MKIEDRSLEEQVAQLPQRDRARLALKLIESLEPAETGDVAELWLQEAEGRLKRYDDGAPAAKDADQALSEIERQLK